MRRNSRMFTIALAGLMLVVAGTAAASLTVKLNTASIRQVPESGNLYTYGEVAEYINIKAAGSYIISVKAAGTPAGGVWPIMAVSIDNLAREQKTVNTSTMKTYSYTVTLTAQVHTIGFKFLNDALINNEDRNLYLDYMVITQPKGKTNPVLSTQSAWYTACRTRETTQLQQTATAIQTNRMGSATITVLNAAGQAVPGAAISVEQTSHDFLFGANIMGWEQFGNAAKDDAYKNQFGAVFNYATAPFYWPLLEPVKGQPQYARNDAIAAWCAARGIRVKGHPIFWNNVNGIPAWANGAQPSPDDCLAHLQQVMTRYQSTIQYWEVVNEPVNCPGLPLDTPHRWARAVNPNATLIINEYGQFYNGLPDFYTLLQNASASGVQYDAVGFQAHAPVNAAFPLEHVKAYLDKYAALGKTIHITEFTPPSSGAAVLLSPWRGTWTEAQQAEYAEAFYRVCFAHPSVTAISWWDFCDTGAWAPGGGLLRSDTTPKPAYTALKRIITEEWRTKLQKTSDASGKATMSGYYGGYLVVVTANGITQETTFRITKGQTNAVTVKLGSTAKSATSGTAVQSTATGETLVIPVDATAPVITLKGSASMTLEGGAAFTDPGATARDNLDGDITAAIKVTGSVNTATVGAYTLTYNVKDAAGNAAKPVTRTVSVTDTKPPTLILK